MVSVGVQVHFFFFFACGNQVVLTFIETILPHGLGTLVENQLAIDVQPQFYFITLYVYPMPVPHCFDSCSFVVSFEKIKRCEFFNFALFQDCFACPGLLAIPYEFEGWLFYFCKKDLEF